MKEKCFFKIVIPNYNNGKWLSKCIGSILEQTFQDFVIVVVDDMSTDDSYIEAQKIRQNHADKIHMIRLSEKGFQSTARNEGWKYPIESKYTIFMDGDDWFHDKDVLKDVYDFILANDVDMVIGDFETVGPNGFRRRSNKQIFDINSSSFSMLNGFYCWIRFVKTELVVPFPEKLGCGEDILQFFLQCDNIQTYKWMNRIITCHNTMNDGSVMTSGSPKNVIRNICQFDYFSKLLLTLKENKSKVKNRFIREAIFVEVLRYVPMLLLFIRHLKKEDYV